MRNNMKRIWAMVLAVMMIFSMASGAMAAEYYSGSLSVGGRVKATAAPTKAPTPAPEETKPEPTDELTEDVEPTESPEPTEDVEPTESPEPTESVEPTESPEAPAEETPLPEEEPEVTPEPANEARQAVIAKPGENDTAFLREGPSTDYDRVGKVQNGTVVTVLGEENGWAFIEVDGMQAWISGSFLSFDLSETVEPEETATPEPTAEPTATPEASAEPTDGLEDEIEYLVDENGELVLDENGNPIPVTAEETEVTEEPVATEETQITFERDEEGNLILDENGNPIAIVPEGMEAPAAYLLDENGALVLDENGDPIPVIEEVEEEPVRLVLPLLSESETELPMYAEASAESEVLAMIPVGQMVAVLEIGETWSLVAYADMQGYVLTAKIAMYNQEVTEEETQIVRTISVTSNLEGAGLVDEGTMVILTATLTGFENTNYTMQWQYTPDMGETIVDVPGANDTQYSFPITLENAEYLWRLSVTIHDEAPEAGTAENEAAGEADDGQA